MRRHAAFATLALIFGLALAACGPAGESTEKASGDLVPEKIGETGWVRAEELERFAGDSLFEYIDGAAEMYHKYDFVEVTVARYSKDGSTVTADLYLFEAADRAFGMYTTLRPDEPDTVSLGAEAFSFGPNIVFVKGSHLVNVYSYDDFGDVIPSVLSVATALEGAVPGTSKKPVVFDLFPAAGRVAFTEKIFAEGFLGRGFLTDVYTVEYSVGEERLRLFITSDPAGEKTGRWIEVAGGKAGEAEGRQARVFGEAASLAIVDDYHGAIVAGRRGDRLVGVVGYVPAYGDAFDAWVESLD